MMTVKAISKTIKKPVLKTLDSAIKNSLGKFHQNKNTMKKIAYGIEEKYFGTRHNFASKSVKYLGEERIKNFKYIRPYVVRTERKKNI